MGTKTNPGLYDCYAKADPDEPLFVLLARDPLAPILVGLWARLRALQGCPEHPERGHDDKIVEAVSCASAMQEWRARRTGSR